MLNKLTGPSVPKFDSTKLAQIIGKGRMGPKIDSAKWALKIDSAKWAQKTNSAK